MKGNNVDKFIRNPKKALFRLAAPVVIAMIVQTMYNIVDTAFVGRLGADAIAGVTFSFPLFFILIAIDSGVGVGVASRISRFLGERKKIEAENAAMHGLLASILFSVIVFVLGLFALKPLFLVFGASGNVLKLSMDYMTIILTGVFFMFPSYVLNSIFSAQGDTKTPMKIQIAALILNAVLDFVFIYLLGYGVKGAALATVIAFAFSLLLYLHHIKSSYLHIKLKSFRFSFKLLKEIFSVGIPASLMMFLLSIYVIFLNRFMAYFGTNYVAAFGIAVRLESVALLPVIGFSIALLTLVGMFTGVKRLDLVRGISWYAIKIGVIATSLVGVIFFIYPPIFFRIFTNDVELIRIGSAYLRIDVFTFPMMAISMVISRVMQGMGYGLPGLVVNLVRIFIVAVPLAYLFVYVLGYGYLSIAVAMLLGGIASNMIAVSWLIVKLRNVEIKKINDF